MDIKDLANDLQKSMKEIKETVDQRVKDSDTLLEAKFNNQSANFTAMLEKAQQENAKIEAVQKAEKERADRLEAAFSRIGNGGVVAEGEEKAAKALIESKEKFEKFLRGEITFGRGASNECTLVKAMSTDVNPDGGYLVRPELVDRVVTRNFETSPMRQIATVMTGSSKSLEMIIDDDEVDVENASEGAATSSDSDTPELGVLTITAHKYDSEPRATTEMLEDSYLDVEGWLAKKVADRITRKENTDFVSGTGTSKARGFLTYTAGTSTYARGSIEQVNSGTSGAVTADGSLNVMGSLKEVYQSNAVWVMKRLTYTSFLKLKDSSNQYLFGIDFLKTGIAVPTLAGKRVVFADDMPVAAANSLSVAYGDFAEGYTIYDRLGLIVQRDPFTAKGFVKFYTYKRTGGAVTNFDSIKLMKLAV